MKRFRKGSDPEELVLSQWANDWISARNTNDILNPTTLEFTDEERAQLNASKHSRNVGMFWDLYEWKSDDINRLVKVTL